MLRQFVAQIMGLRQEGQYAQALQVLVQAQERLFARPFPAFATLDIDEQLQLLSAGESKEGVREKHLGYALLLREAGLCYRALDRDDLSASALSLALHVALCIAVTDAEHCEEIADLIKELLSQVSIPTLHEPTRELLMRWSQS
ncbi:MAG: hypothetical protein WC378_16435 [Opitutaceae bacterium]